MKGTIQCTYCPVEQLQARRGKKQHFIEWETGIVIHYPVWVNVTRPNAPWHMALDFNAPMCNPSTSFGKVKTFFIKHKAKTIVVYGRRGKYETDFHLEEWPTVDVQSTRRLLVPDPTRWQKDSHDCLH